MNSDYMRETAKQVFDRLDSLTETELISLFKQHEDGDVAQIVIETGVLQARNVASDDLTSSVAKIIGQKTKMNWSEISFQPLEVSEHEVECFTDISTRCGFDINEECKKVYSQSKYSGIKWRGLIQSGGAASVVDNETNMAKAA